MKKIVLAIAAMAFAHLALAAEGEGDETQPTMIELKQSIDALGVRLGRVENKLNSLATTAALNTLSGTITANHTTIVGKFAQQVAVVTAELVASGSSYRAHLKMLGNSSIPGFPAARNGRTITDNTLPAGTYLFEMHQPYSDNVLCNRSVPVRMAVGTRRLWDVCPMLVLLPRGRRGQPGYEPLHDGIGIYTYATPTAFATDFNVPTGFITDARTAAGYSAAIKITKLK